VNRFSPVFALFLVLMFFPHYAKAQSWDFVGEWEISLVKRYPPRMEIKYPVHLSIRTDENGNLTASYTDPEGHSDKCTNFLVMQNEILFTTGRAGKKNLEYFGPVHRAILKNGRLIGFVFTDSKQFEWIGKRLGK